MDIKGTETLTTNRKDQKNNLLEIYRSNLLHKAQGKRESVDRLKWVSQEETVEAKTKKAICAHTTRPHGPGETNLRVDTNISNVTGRGWNNHTRNIMVLQNR